MADDENEIIEGKASLDVDGFAKALERIEQAAGQTATRIQSAFQKIETAFEALANFSRGNVEQANAQLRSLASNTSTLATASQTAATQMKAQAKQQADDQRNALNAMTADARAWKANLEVTNAEAAKSFEAFAAKYQDAAKQIQQTRDLGALTNAQNNIGAEVGQRERNAAAATDEVIAAKRRLLEAERQVAEAMATGKKEDILAARQLAQEQRQAVDVAIQGNAQVQAELKQAVALQKEVQAQIGRVTQEYNQLGQAIERQKQAEQKTANTDASNQKKAQLAADMQAAKQAAEDQATILKQLSDEKKRVLQQQLQVQAEDNRRTVQMARENGAALLEEQQTGLQNRLRNHQAAINQELDMVRRAAAEQQRVMVQANRAAGNATTAEDFGGFKMKAVNAQAEMRDAVEREKALMKQLQGVSQTVRDSQTAYAQSASQAQIRAAQTAAQAQEGYWARVGRAVTRAGEEIKQVEQRYNSLFRAGSQISSVGTQVSMLSAAIIGTGVALKDGAEDFDFWIRRSEAAAISAGSAWKNESQTLNEAIQSTVENLGLAVGNDNFAEVAQAFYVYQAAAGDAINTTADLQIAQENLQTVFQVAAMTGDPYEQVTKGLLQVLAAFGGAPDQLGKFATILQNTTQITQAEFQDMIESYKYLGPLMSQVGMTVEGTSAIFGKLSEQGLKGSNAGRGIQMAMEALVSPSAQASEALDNLFISTGRTTEGWRAVLQPGGDVLSLLDEIDSSGNKTTGMLTELAMALNKLPNEAAQMDAINRIFPAQNAARQMMPLLIEEMEKLNGVTREGVIPLSEMYENLKNTGMQSQMFSEQWEIMAESIRIRFGQAVGEIKKNFLSIGTAAAEVMLPYVQAFGRVLTKVMEWAQANESAFRSILKVVAAIGALAAVLGPVLIVVGSLVQGLSALPVVLQAFRSGFGLVAAQASGFGATLVGLLNPLTLLAGVVSLLSRLFVVGLIGALMRNEQFVGSLKTAWESLQTVIGMLMKAFEGLAKIISGVFSGNKDEAQQGATQFATELARAIGTFIPMVAKVFSDSLPIVIQSIAQLIVAIGQALPGMAHTIVQELARTFLDDFESLEPSMKVWGWNLVVALGEGLLNAAGAFISDIVNGIAELIAQPFRSYSPPRYGPLKGIYIWGRNLISTFLDGAKSADIDAIYEVADRIGGALTDSFDAGWAQGSWLDGAKKGYELTAEMLEIVRQGGTVNKQFFEPLKAYLGEWYEDIVKINLAYQQVYALERNIALEKQRLEVIQAQREVLNAQLQIKNDLFDTKVDPTGGDYYKPYQDQMADPTTAEGQARIASMRESLSKEDFQSWISFQRKLWESRHKEEDAVLKVQEDAINVSLKAQEAQLKMVKDQYDTYVKMYEYALKLSNLDDSDPTKDKGGSGGGGSDKIDDDADLEDLRKAREKVKGIVGDDQAIKDEGTLKDERGDEIGAIGGADEQRDREAGRIKDLDAVNRRIKAEFDARKIAAKGNEEALAQIKKEEEAWNTAYREEKARLADRKADTEDILDATQEAADKTENERNAEKRSEFEKEIKDTIGEQVPSLETAEQIKARTGDLDKAAIDSQLQLRKEERDLSDLRDLNQAKQLDFQERINQAGGDEETIRRIKEEQEAWELSYKAALAAQEARTKAARQADQDINDEQQAVRNTGGDFGAGGGSSPFGGAGPKLGAGGINIGDAKKDDEPSLPEQKDPPAAPAAQPEDKPKAPAGPPEAPMSEYEKERIRQERIRAGGTSLDGAPGERFDMANLGANYFASWLIGILPGYQSDADRLDDAYKNEKNKGVPGYVPENLEGDGFWGDLKNTWGGFTDGFMAWMGDAADKLNNMDVSDGTNLPDQLAEDLRQRSSKFDDVAKEVWDRNLSFMNDKSNTISLDVVNKLNGPDGPFASSSFALGQVNGVWRQVLRDGQGNPTQISKEALDLIKGSFYDTFTGDKSPTTTIDDALTKMGLSTYAKMTGDKSPPATMAEMVNNLGIESYKMLTGSNSPPATIAEMNNQIGSKMYELITGEKAPGKMSQEFVEKMLGVYENLGIDGPIPNSVEGAMQKVSEAILTKMSPNGVIPKDVKSALDIMGADFLTKFSPNGQIPKTMEEAMRLLGTGVSNAMQGPGSIVDLTNNALLMVKGGYSNLKDAPDGIPAIVSATGENAKNNMKRQFLEDGGMVSISEDATGHVVTNFNKLKEGDGNIVGTTDNTISALILAFSKFGGDDPGQPKSTMRLFFEGLQTRFREGLFGEGSVSTLFNGLASSMVSTAMTTFGPNGQVATLFGQAASAAATAAGRAAEAAARYVNAKDNQAEGTHFAGIDRIPGGESQPRKVIVHGDEAILNKQDAGIWRASKTNGLIALLQGAVRGTARLAGAVGAASRPEARLGAGSAERSIMPTERRELGQGVGKTQNIYISELNMNDKDDYRRFMKDASRF